MANADDLRTLAEDCIKAYETRMEALASIRQQVSHIKEETARMLDGFKEADKERGSEVYNLKKGVSDLLDNFRETDSERKKEISVLRDNLREELDGFRKECEDTAKVWHDLVVTMRAKRTGAAPRKPPKPSRRGAQEMGRVSGHKR